MAAKPPKSASLLNAISALHLAKMKDQGDAPPMNGQAQDPAASVQPTMGTQAENIQADTSDQDATPMGKKALPKSAKQKAAIAAKMHGK